MLLDNIPLIDSNIKTKFLMNLGSALNNNEFYLAYQPQVNMHGEVTGAEALARWKHPWHGDIQPDKFIPAMEKSGLIIGFGRWVLTTACRQLALWSNSKQLMNLSISVNVSILEFRQPDFASNLLAIIEETGANVENLKIELTESLAVESVDNTIKKMEQLKLSGVKFSLDDFGTGYSSLSILKNLPLDQLKIDKSFVFDMLTNPIGAAMVSMIITLAQKIGITVIAEGVEAVEQREFLIQNGCFDFQGYLFSRALPIMDFERYFIDGLRKDWAVGKEYLAAAI